MLLCGLELYRFILVFFHLGANHEYLSALTDKLSYKTIESCPVAFIYGKGINLFSAGGKLVYDRYIQISIYNQCQCTGDGGCRHDEHMGLLAFPNQC